MAARVDSESMIRDLPAVYLENDSLAVAVLPTLGAKIYELLWKETGKQVLWHNPRIRPREYPIDGNFDNYWCGGWDECFPTNDPCEHKGDFYPNLGEFRSVRWAVEEAWAAAEEPMVRLSAFGPISPVRAEKTITLLAGRWPEASAG